MRSTGYLSRSLAGLLSESNSHANLGGTMSFQSNDDPRVEDLVRALITWLQNWRAAPREQSKAADWALVVVSCLAVVAAEAMGVHYSRPGWASDLH
jgi:hypothetical protein